MRLKEIIIMNEELDIESSYQDFLAFSNKKPKQYNKIERLHAFSTNDSSDVRLLPRKPDTTKTNSAPAAVDNY